MGVDASTSAGELGTRAHAWRRRRRLAGACRGRATEHTLPRDGGSWHAPCACAHAFARVRVRPRMYA
eukprot:3477135-Pleurochrysis_carterae.AAC.1